ncbi:uncharacterized protein BN565_00925 [Clostridium sp. CAG:253]|nr:uncharacterized protein BN565_00925 [Clostridium sp. CAG:253]
MRRKVGRKVISTVLSAALITSGIAFQSSDISAAKKVTKLTLNKKSATLYQGADKAYSSITLKATVKPSKAAKVKFTTSNKKIATVTAKGVVKAKKAGKVTITAKAGSKKAVCKVTVKKVSKKVKKVTVKKSKVTVYVGKTSKISATVTPAKATIKKVKYTTSNKKVATVTAKGVIKGVKAGTAKITVAAVDGSKKKTTVTVTVKKKAAKPSTAPTTEPSTAPSIAPTTEPSAKPATSPSISPSPSATPGNNGGGSSSSGDTTPVYSEVKAIDNGNGTVTYPLNTDKTYKVIYGSESAEITARDVETIMTYVKTYAGQANTYNTVASAYEKFNAKIKTAEGQSASLDNLDAGKVTVKLTGNDTYHITVAGKANTSANGEYDVKVTVLGDNVKVETTDSTNKTVTGTITSITAKKIVAKDIKVTKDTKVVDIASATVELSDPYVRVTVPKSDKLSNLKVYAK